MVVSKVVNSIGFQSAYHIKPPLLFIPKPSIMVMDVFTLESSLYLPFLVSIPVLFFLFFRSKPSSSNQRSPREPKTYPFLGALPEFIKNRHRFLEWITEVLAGIPTQTMVFQAPGQNTRIFTANPEVVEYVLKTKSENFPKGEGTITKLEDFLGHGIFNSDGEDWKSQRKTASYEFNKRSLRNFVMETVHFELTSRFLPVLEVAVEGGGVLDLQDVLQRFAFDNICKVAFNVDPACLSKEVTDPPNFMEAFDDSAKLISDRFMEIQDVIWRIKKFFNIGSERRLRQSIKIVHDFAIEIIRKRKNRHSSPSGDSDLLSRFSSNSDNTDEFLRDVVVNFLLAGRETTSSALVWFFWLLSSNPDVEKKILEEVRSIKSRNQQTCTDMFNFEELREMNYLHAAISESMRLYPPVVMDTVASKDDDILPGGMHIGKDWLVTYSAYSMGRMENIWGRDCCEFKPERWLVDGVFQPESPFKFTTFHGGPRMCLGKEMAYIQMKSIVACFLDRFQYVVMKERPPEYVLSLTIRMKGGLPIQVKRRTGKE